MSDTRKWAFCVMVGGVLLLNCMAVQAQSLEERVQRLEEATKESGNTFRVFWKHGLRLQTRDEEIDIRIGGRIQNDWNFTFPSDEIEDAFGDPEDRIFFRRAQVFIRGTLYRFIDFKAEYDFAGGDVNFTDVYLRLKTIPYIGNVFVGKFKTPFGLEEQTSSRFITFQERSLTDAFVPGRELGFKFMNTVLNKRMTWAIAGTRQPDNDSTFDTDGSGDDWNVTLRLTGVPWFAEKGRRLVHFGFAYAFRNFVDDEARFRVRPEAQLRIVQDGDESSVRFVDTGTFDAKWGNLIGFENALVYGPFSLQGEFMLAFGQEAAEVPPGVDEDDIEEATFYGFYVMASYFLTGEHRPYSTSSAAFGRPIPKQNFLQGGYGAWEVAFRVSGIDLDDAEDFNGSGAGGHELNLTFGVNWYPNPNTRVIINYVYGLVDDRLVTNVDLDNDDFGVFMMRFQVDF